MEESFAHINVVKLVMSRGGREIKGIVAAKGDRVFIMPNGVTLRLPDGHARIPESVVKELSELKLEMSHLEYDYWFTNQGKDA